MNKVLIAVLHSRMAPWGTMHKTARETWDSVDVENVQTVFYTGAPATPIQDRLVGFDVDDTYYTIGRKNLKAYKWMLDNYDFDIMVRVNASTFVHKPRAFEHCQSLPKTGMVRCARVHTTDKPAWAWGGYGFIVSRDVISKVVEHGNLWDHAQMEDVAFSWMLTTLGYSLDEPILSGSIDKQDDGSYIHNATDGKGKRIQSIEELKDTNHFLFRVKQDHKRHLDREIMIQLYDLYFRR